MEYHIFDADMANKTAEYFKIISNQQRSNFYRVFNDLWNCNFNIQEAAIKESKDALFLLKTDLETFKTNLTADKGIASYHTEQFINLVSDIHDRQLKSSAYEGTFSITR
jgi:hypothetical protein